MATNDICRYCGLSTSAGPSGRRECRCVFRSDAAVAPQPGRPTRSRPRPVLSIAPDIATEQSGTPSFPFFSPSPWAGHARGRRPVRSAPTAVRPPGPSRLAPAAPLVILPPGETPAPHRAG